MLGQAAAAAAHHNLVHPLSFHNYPFLKQTPAGWNVDPVTGEKLAEVSTEEQDLSLVTAYTALRKRKQAGRNVPGSVAAAADDGFAGPAGTAKAAAATAGAAVPGDDSARGGVPGGSMV